MKNCIWHYLLFGSVEAQRWRNSPPLASDSEFAVKPKSFHGKNDYRWEVAGCHKLPIQAQPHFLQFLVSDSFPNINPAETECTWKINAPRGYGIRLTWREFHIDGCGRSAIYIFDGKETDGIEPDRYCGKQKPRDWSSTGSTVHVKLSHAETSTPKGFKIMLGFEARKFKVKPFISDYASIDSLQNGTSSSIGQSDMVQSGSDLSQSYGSEGQPSPRLVPPRLKGDIYTFKKQEENIETADVKADRIFQIIIPSLIAVIAIAVIIKTFINGRKKNIEDIKPEVQISASQKTSNRTTLKSIKRDETEKNIRKNSSASKPNTMIYMQEKPSFDCSSTKAHKKTSRIKSQGSRPTVKESKQSTTTKSATKLSTPKQVTTKTQKITNKTKTLARKSRKKV